jgi:preprotein translocase subunit SecE
LPVVRCPLSRHRTFLTKKEGVQHQQNFVAMEKLTLYLKESYQELMQNVSWPTTAQLQESTTVVLVTAAVLSGIIFFMDGFCKFLFESIYGVS